MIDAAPGPMALVGSGEFTPATEAVDLALLEGRARRAVFLPTAAAPEGPETVSYWVELGRSHYQRLGVEATPLLVLNRDDAEREELAAEISGAGLVYLSGGDPTYLASALVGTSVGNAIRDAWAAGTAVAGCSAGAIALTQYVPDIRHLERPAGRGLGLVSNLAVMPHFDQLEKWMPGATQWALDALPDGMRLIGVEEETALVGGPHTWRVIGRRRVWELHRGGNHIRHHDGDIVEID